MDPPPPSQSQTTPRTTLFSNPDGTPIRVFTQADLFGRAKVLKGLRLNGAELLSDASSSQIMLVDPPTRQGRQFIRDWGKDNNKTVLSFTWVKKCLEAERPLLSEDQWGDCLAQDDGRPIDAGEGSDDVLQEGGPKSPLPTPRVTPEELAKRRSRKTAERQASVNAKPQVDEASIAPLSPPPTASSSSAPMPPDTMSSQPFSPAGMSPMTGMNPLMFMQNPAAMSMQNIPPSVLAFTAQATQAMMANMFMNANTNMVPNQQQPFTNNGFMLALQDSMRNAVTGWPGMQPQNGPLPASQPVSPLPEPPVPYPSAPSNSRKRETSNSPSPMDMSEPSVSRRISSVSESGEAFRKGKSKERTPAAKRRKVSSSSVKDIEMDDKNASPPAGSSSHEMLFKTKSGRPLSFFVQIEIHNRFKLVSIIKKNGGIIVDTPTLADYAILYAGNQKQKVFKTLLQAAYNASVPAVQAKFLHDCLSKGKVLDPKDYLYEPEFKGKPRRSVSWASVESESENDKPVIDEAERKRLAKNARQAERRLRTKMEKEAEAKQNATPGPARAKTPKSTSRRAKSVDSSYPRATDGPRTPSPPPENTREPCPQGYRFSRTEDDFALRFAKVLIDRDYTISQSAVTSVIHKKLPHHSLLSWRSHFNVIATEWDTWRKRAAIVHRKAQIQKQAEAASSSSAPVGPMATIEVVEEAPFGLVPNGNTGPDWERDLEDDIRTVVQFFVEGNDRDQSEDECLVWQRLAAKMPCKTENSWETFYEKHAQVVIERYNAAI